VASGTFGAGSAAVGSGAPDTHLFRVENGKLHYVHTLTVVQIAASFVLVSSAGLSTHIACCKKFTSLLIGS
jgi:hypothetical protein